LSYTTGPDGKRYATAGEVPVDLSPITGDPAATIQKLEQVARAALAPANPSNADRRVAARAARLIGQARKEVMEDAMKQKEIEARPDAPSQTNAAAESTVDTSSAKTSERDGTPTASTSARETDALAPIEAAQTNAGSPHHRPHSVSPDAQAPVKLNLSIYA